MSHLPTIFTIIDDDYKESSMNYPSIFRRENEKCSKKEGNSAKRPRDDALYKESEVCRADEGHGLHSRKRHCSKLEHEAS